MLTILYVSIAVLVIAFIFAAANMGAAVKGNLNENTFVRHLLCMVLMVIGWIGTIGSGLVLVLRFLKS